MESILLPAQLGWRGQQNATRDLLVFLTTHPGLGAGTKERGDLG